MDKRKVSQDAEEKWAKDARSMDRIDLAGSGNRDASAWYEEFQDALMARLIE